MFIVQSRFYNVIALIKTYHCNTNPKKNQPMNISVQLPDSSIITEKMVKAVDILCAVFPPKDMRELYQAHQLEMVLHTTEEIEQSQAITDLLDVLCGD